ncbi:hypothetical protein GCM10028808_54740 [Spirosoma migulaei]
MKGYLVVLLLVTLSTGTPAFSQDKIEGIGRFKIGKASRSLVQAIATETGMPIETVDSAIKTEKSTQSQIVEIKSNLITSKVSHTPLHAPVCEHVRVFYINNFREAGIELKSVYLFFKDDILIKFTCYATSQLNSAMELSYGQPEVTITKLYSDCDLDAKSFLLTWANGGITATLSLLVNYDVNCRKRVNQEFSIALKENRADCCEEIVNIENK